MTTTPVYYSESHGLVAVWIGVAPVWREMPMRAPKYHVALREGHAAEAMVRRCIEGMPAMEHALHELEARFATAVARGHWPAEKAKTTPGERAAKQKEKMAAKARENAEYWERIAASWEKQDHPPPMSPDEIRDKVFEEQLRAFFANYGAASFECWSVLGVDPHASVAEVKAAFRRHALTHHPDRGGSADEFIRIKTAYDRAVDLASTREPVAPAKRKGRDVTP